MSVDAWRVGVGSADVTGPVCSVGMMGYGQAHQQVRGVSTPLTARAYVVESPSSGVRLAFVSAEIWGITQSVQQAVSRRLVEAHPEVGLAEHNVMLTATHTHSGPGGYSHHLLFNLSIPGYVAPIYEAIVDGIVEALVQAVEALQPGTVSLQRGEIPPDEQVGFNRAMKAYNRNVDVAPLPPSHAHLAIDREMTVLRLDTESGHPLGAISWFGVHGCSLHADNHDIHPDNKGMAAMAFERHAAEVWETPQFKAAFPQTTPGDVTPNFRWSRHRGVSLGARDDDLESAAHNGDIQFRQARALFEACAPSDRLNPTLRASLRYFDYADLPVDADLGHQVQGARTGSATIGLMMAAGTEDGPGPLFGLKALPWLLSRCVAGYHWLRRLVRGKAQADASNPHGNKVPFLQVGRGRRGRLLGMFRQDRPPVPGALDPTVARLKALCRRDALGDRAWSPEVLPLQLFQFGDLAVVAVPFEPTTVAGRRIVRVMRETLAPLGVTHVVVSGYANAYGGYLTTREEYQVQDYEGASNYNGQWTLAATLTQLRHMARELVATETPTLGVTPEGLRPEPFSATDLAQRAWEGTALVAVGGEAAP